MIGVALKFWCDLFCNFRRLLSPTCSRPHSLGHPLAYCSRTQAIIITCLSTEYLQRSLSRPIKLTYTMYLSAVLGCAQNRLRLERYRLPARSDLALIFFASRSGPSRLLGALSLSFSLSLCSWIHWRPLESIIDRLSHCVSGRDSSWACASMIAQL
jgi:hypothetical protein